MFKRVAIVVTVALAVYALFVVLLTAYNLHALVTPWLPAIGPPNIWPWN